MTFEDKFVNALAAIFVVAGLGIGYYGRSLMEGHGSSVSPAGGLVGQSAAVSGANQTLPQINGDACRPETFGIK